jgi:hypothetical protein
MPRAGSQFPNDLPDQSEMRETTKNAILRSMIQKLNFQKKEFPVHFKLDIPTIPFSSKLVFRMNFLLDLLGKDKNKNKQPMI